MSKVSLRPLSREKVEIPKDRYAADFELYDRFQNYSAELLKLSLAGIGVVGFFLTTIAGDKSGRFGGVLQSPWFVFFSVAAVLALAAAVACSLAHRFFSSDGMFHHIRAIKLLILHESRGREALPDADRAALLAKVTEEEECRNKKLRHSERCLWIAAGGLFVGAAMLGGAFLKLLFPPQ